MRILAAAAAAVVVLVSTISAHDVPDDITLQVFLRPAGDRLSMLVRVPLAAMRDVDVPTRGGAYVNLDRVEPALRHAATVWLTQGIELFEDGRPLPRGGLAAVRLSLPSDRAFQSFETARRHLREPPLDPRLQLLWEQGALDALIEFPIQGEGGRLGFRADVRRLGLRVTTVVRLVEPTGAVRAFEWHGDAGLVELDPRWHQAALSFLRAGIGHVLSGADHLLFLLCIAIPLRRLRTLALVVTSFTVAHAATLVASAYGFAPGGAWFPPLVETLIALSIVWMALENIVESAGSGAAEPAAAARALRRRWAVTAAFGLVHGFGFSFALRDQLQFAGAHLLTSLLAFNAGVEIAQLGVILAALGGIALAFRWVVAPRVGAIVLSAIAAHTGWHWLLDRGAVLWQFPWPAVSLAALGTLGVWLVIAATAAAAAWAVRALASRRASRPAVSEPPVARYSHEVTESIR